MNRLVSVVMSTYNESDRDLSESIESVLNQTHSNFEFIIVNDNPKNEALRNKLAQYSKEPRVRIIENSKNSGVAFSRNHALKYTHGYYTAVLDGDDVCYPERLEKELAYLEAHPDCDLVASAREDIDENSVAINKFCGVMVSDKTVNKILKYGNIITHSTVMVKTSILKKLNGYRSFRSAQDYDVWLRMVSMNCKFHLMPEVLTKYRIRQQGITNSNFARSFYELKYIRQLYFERLKNNGQDSYSEDNFIKATSIPPGGSAALNEQYELIKAIKSNHFQLKKVGKLLLGLLTCADCRLNLLLQMYNGLLIKASNFINNLPLNSRKA